MVMGRLMAIDYGRVRCGVAATDAQHIAASPLATVETRQLEAFLREYFGREEVEGVVVGLPLQMSGDPSESQAYIRPAVGRLRKAFPDVRFDFFDERFTSVLAHRAMIDAGMRKSKRRQRGQTDMLSACIILNDYLDSIHTRLSDRSK